jgi:cysteine-rich repeat protein
LCAIPRCGDGIVSTCPDNIEACDDGNDIDTDSCSNSCIRNVAAVGCRITGGRYVLDGAQEQGPDAEIIRGQGGGQVGAPCGCIGCFDEFDHIQGQWQYSRKRKQGNFHAREFNSLICGCDQDGACNSDGVNGSAFADSAAFNGQLCNPGEPESGPEPRPSPANVACFSGIGGWAATPGKREIPVAFRVEVEDRGEPAGGEHADGTCDVYQIRIWIPSSGETAAGLADLVCCIDGYDTMGTVRPPDVQDGGNLVHGNIQIHPMTPNSQDGTCPVPDGTCQEP